MSFTDGRKAAFTAAGSTTAIVGLPARSPTATAVVAGSVPSAAASASSVSTASAVATTTSSY